MSTPRDAGRVVIVGGGLAGYSAAEQLRSLGHEGTITVIDAESATYDRPPLSKRLFDADFTIESLTFADETKLAERHITGLFGRSVVELDPQAATVYLEDGTAIEADTVLIATGGRARTLPIPGIDLPGVHVLRTFADATALRNRLTAGTRAVVIGAGLIGAELASSMVNAGAAVTLVDPATTPLVPAVGELMASHLHGMHSANGVRTIVGITERIDQAADHLTVITDDGTTLDADVVVVGVGMVPVTKLAETAGLAVDNGILVSSTYQTSAPKVFAAGDVARIREEDGTLHRREEHWEAAQLSGQHVACAMLGLDIPARGALWFWSDRHGIHLEATGRLTGTGELVTRAGGAHPAVFLLDDGLLVGTAAIDDNNTVRAARRIIDQAIPVTAAELADSSVPLRALLRASR